MKKVLFLSLPVLIAVYGICMAQAIRYDTNLCANNEKVLFSFKMKNSSKILSLLAAKDKSYVVYRYGTRENIELEYPQNKKNSWAQFTWNQDSGSLGYVNHALSFQNGSFTYYVVDLEWVRSNTRQVYAVVVNNKNDHETLLEGISEGAVGGIDERLLEEYNFVKGDPVSILIP